MMTIMHASGHVHTNYQFDNGWTVHVCHSARQMCSALIIPTWLVVEGNEGMLNGYIATYDADKANKRYCDMSDDELVSVLAEVRARKPTKTVQAKSEAASAMLKEALARRDH